MKNFKKIIILTVALMIVGGSIFFFRQSSKSDTTGEAGLNEEASVAPKAMTKTITKVKDNKLVDQIAENEISAKSESFSKFDEFTVEEKKALLILSSFIGDASKNDLPMDTLVDTLKELKLKPVIMKNENEYTGSLNIVRTKDALPGTRYVHAQYFEGEDTPSFLQHLSYEFRPGKKSFEMVKQSVIMKNNITSAPTRESKTFVSWSVGEKVIWIKELSLEDISQPNPINAYDVKSDVGTIRVAIENEIH